MKLKLMAVFLMIVMIISLMSCGDSSENDVSLPEMPSLSSNEIVSYTIYRPPVNNFEKFSNLDEWQNILLENYNVDISIEYISPLHQSAIASSTYYPDAIANGDIIGLIDLNTGDFVNLAVLRDMGLILPLDEYLADNEIYQTFPENLKSAFKMSDGKTWALPTQTINGLYSRNIKKSWLSNLGYEAPSNLDELYQVSKAFAYDDPNGNNLNDEHGMDIHLRTTSRMLADIFLANDCYLSSYFASSIAYDYETGAYEDAILKPGMLDSVLYIRRLYSEGILHINNSWDFREREGFGNYFDLSSFFPADDQWHKTYTFNTNDYPSAVALKPESCLIMTKGTENPSQTINSFVDTFMGSANGMAMGLFGVPEVNYSSEGNTITQLTEFSDTSSLRLTGFNAAIIASENIEFESEFYDEAYLERLVSEHNKIEELYQKGLLFTDSWLLPHTDYKKAQRSFAETFYFFLMDIDNMSAEDFINNYLDKAQKGGYADILNDLNEDAGSVAQYSYD